MEAWDTKVMLEEGTSGANMGRMTIGSTIGMEAFGSPWSVGCMLVGFHVGMKNMEARCGIGGGKKKKEKECERER